MQISLGRDSITGNEFSIDPTKHVSIESMSGMENPPCSSIFSSNHIRQGNGGLFIDPHGDTADQIARLSSRKADAGFHSGSTLMPPSSAVQPALFQFSGGARARQGVPFHHFKYVTAGQIKPPIHLQIRLRLDLLRQQLPQHHCSVKFSLQSLAHPHAVRTPASSTHNVTATVTNIRLTPPSLAPESGTTVPSAPALHRTPAQQRRRNRPRQHQPIIDRRHAPKNQLPQSSRATAAAIVAIPTHVTVAVRSPAKITTPPAAAPL